MAQRCSWLSLAGPSATPEGHVTPRIPPAGHHGTHSLVSCLSSYPSPCDVSHPHKNPSCGPARPQGSATPPHRHPRGQSLHHLHPPQGTRRAFSRLGLFQSLVNSGTREGPQEGLNVVPELPRALYTDPQWEQLAQYSPGSAAWPGRQDTWVLGCPGLASFLTLGSSAPLPGLGCLKSLDWMGPQISQTFHTNIYGSLR